MGLFVPKFGLFLFAITYREMGHFGDRWITRYLPRIPGNLGNLLLADEAIFRAIITASKAPFSTISAPPSGRIWPEIWPILIRD